MLMVRSQDREKLYPLTNGLYVYGNTVLIDLGGTIEDGKRRIAWKNMKPNPAVLKILDENSEKNFSIATIMRVAE